ncbi:hypothetical protein JCM3766R1_003882 [Sporobolomyces carnicolor]
MAQQTSHVGIFWDYEASLQPSSNPRAAFMRPTDRRSRLEVGSSPDRSVIVDAAIALRNLGVPADTTVSRVVASLIALAKSYGSLSVVKAYLDTDILRSHKGKKLRGELQSNAVTISDTPHRGHKEVADAMMITDALVFGLERTPSVVILVTSDEGFAYPTSILKQKSCKVVLVADEVHLAKGDNASIRADLKIGFRSDLLKLGPSRIQPPTWQAQPRRFANPVAYSRGPVASTSRVIASNSRIFDDHLRPVHPPNARPPAIQAPTTRRTQTTSLQDRDEEGRGKSKEARRRRRKREQAASASQSLGVLTLSDDSTSSSSRSTDDRCAPQSNHLSTATSSFAPIREEQDRSSVPLTWLSLPRISTSTSQPKTYAAAVAGFSSNDRPVTQLEPDRRLRAVKRLRRFGFEDDLEVMDPLANPRPTASSAPRQSDTMAPSLKKRKIWEASTDPRTPIKRTLPVATSRKTKDQLQRKGLDGSAKSKSRSKFLVISSDEDER